MSDARTYDYASARITVDGREVATRPAASVGPQRPALANVLAALMGSPVGIIRSYCIGLTGLDISPTGVTFHYDRTLVFGLLHRTEPAYEPRRVGDTVQRVEVTPAHTITPAEAVEVLHTRDLWPWAPGDDPTRWWCSPPVPRAPGDRFIDCLTCNDVGHANAPPTLGTLVAVASLGCDTLRTAEDLTREFGVRSIVWRVMTRESLAQHHERVGRERSGAEEYGASHPLATLYSVEEWRAADGRLVAWPEACPWRGIDDSHPAHRAWPALRDLAALGVHLLAIDGARVTIGVEAI